MWSMECLECSWPYVRPSVRAALRLSLCLSVCPALLGALLSAAATAAEAAKLEQGVPQLEGSWWPPPASAYNARHWPGLAWAKTGLGLANFCQIRLGIIISSSSSSRRCCLCCPVALAHFHPRMRKNDSRSQELKNCVQ